MRLGDVIRAGVFAVLALSSSAQAQPNPSDLLGTWHSRTCEAASETAPISILRIFTIGHSWWTTEVTFHDGARCATPLFGFRIAGAYVLQGAPDASNRPAFGTFFYANKTAWALTPDGASRLTAAGCGPDVWRPGAIQDIAHTGCLAFRAITDTCRQEFDLVSITGNELRFGARSPEMCREEGRPKALSAFPLIRLPFP
jgi:hypothetical protein